MGENFVSATTRIQALLTQKKQILQKVAGYVADAVMDRVKNNKLNQTAAEDIKKILAGYSDEEKVDILANTIVLMGIRSSSPVNTFDDDDDYYSRKPAKKKDRSSLFG